MCASQGCGRAFWVLGCRCWTGPFPVEHGAGSRVKKNIMCENQKILWWKFEPATCKLKVAKIRSPWCFVSFPRIQLMAFFWSSINVKNAIHVSLRWTYVASTKPTTFGQARATPWFEVFVHMDMFVLARSTFPWNRIKVIVASPQFLSLKHPQAPWLLKLIQLQLSHQTNPVWMELALFHPGLNETALEKFECLLKRSDLKLFWVCFKLLLILGTASK